MRLLDRLRKDVAEREFEVWAVIFPATIFEHRHHATHAVFPDFLLVLHLAAERGEFGDAGALTHAKFDTPVADQIKARDLLRDTRGMIRGQLDDAMAETDVFRALGRGGEEHLGLR